MAAVIVNGGSIKIDFPEDLAESLLVSFLRQWILADSFRCCVSDNASIQSLVIPSERKLITSRRDHLLEEIGGRRIAKESTISDSKSEQQKCSGIKGLIAVPYCSAESEGPTVSFQDIKRRKHRRSNLTYAVFSGSTLFFTHV